MSEKIVDTMERNAERMGNLRMIRDSRDYLPLRRAVDESRKELGINNDLYDVRNELTQTVLYFDGIMNEETRQKLLAKLAKKLGTHAEYYKIVAFYN